MTILRVSRRAALTFGASLIGAFLLSGRQSASAQTPAPVQVPRSPAPVAPAAPTTPAAPMPPTSPSAGAPSAPNTPAGGGAMQAGGVQGTWLWQRTEMSNDTVITAVDPCTYVLSLTADGRMTF